MEIPRVPLILTPTPLHRLDRMSERLGIDLWIKRDDLTGFALGGNKGRKLEYLLADILAKGVDTVVTCGSLQSNFIRQLAAACAVYDLKCAAAVMPLPYEHEPPQQDGLTDTGGNVLLDNLLGADLRILPNATWEELFAAAATLAVDLRRQGRKVYEMPIGGSSPLGAYAFFRAAQEIEIDPDWIVFASSSGSTHTGLAYAFRGTTTQVLGVACDPEPEIVDDFQELYEGLEALTGEQRPITREDWLLDSDHVGLGYGVPSEAGNEAIRLLAQTEGIFLDPIYSGKAFAALLTRVERGDLTGKVLFWHTGGLPTLFAMT